MIHLLSRIKKLLKVLTVIIVTMVTVMSTSCYREDVQIEDWKVCESRPYGVSAKVVVDDSELTQEIKSELGKPIIIRSKQELDEMVLIGIPKIDKFFKVTIADIDAEPVDFNQNNLILFYSSLTDVPGTVESILTNSGNRYILAVEYDNFPATPGIKDNQACLVRTVVQAPLSKDAEIMGVVSLPYD